MKVPTVAPHPHQHLRFTVNVLGFGHSNRCVMESMWFSLHFPDDPEYRTSLDAYLISVYLLWSGVCPGILLIFNQVVLLLLYFKNSLYILDNSHFSSVQFSRSVVSNSLRPHKSPFTDTFFSSLCLVFSFSWQSSTGQKLLVCLESSLSIIYFTEHILVLSVKRHCPTQGHLGFPLCFFPEVLYFCLLHVGLWSTFHSFLWAGAKSIFRFAFFFFFFAWGCLVSPASFVEKTCFITLPLLLCGRVVACI